MYTMLATTNSANINIGIQAGAWHRKNKPTPERCMKIIVILYIGDNGHLGY